MTSVSNDHNFSVIVKVENLNEENSETNEDSLKYEIVIDEVKIEFEPVTKSDTLNIVDPYNGTAENSDIEEMTKDKGKLSKLKETSIFNTIKPSTQTAPLIVKNGQETAKLHEENGSMSELMRILQQANPRVQKFRYRKKSASQKEEVEPSDSATAATKRKRDLKRERMAVYYQKIKKEKNDKLDDMKTVEKETDNQELHNKEATDSVPKLRVKNFALIEEIEKPKKSGKESWIVDELVRRRELARARVQKYRERKKIACKKEEAVELTDLESVAAMELDRLVAEEKIKRRRELGRERASRYRQRRRTEALKSTAHPIQD